MSSSIWKLCKGVENIGSLNGKPWRVEVEAAAVVMRRLVDTEAEALVLDRWLEVDLGHPSGSGLDQVKEFLLRPFSPPPRRFGSRFGTRHERGLWYGSEWAATAFAEAAFYRFHAIDDSGGVPKRRTNQQLVVFEVPVDTDAAVDLTVDCFEAHREAISSPISFESSQALGSEMRNSGVEAFLYYSARDPNEGKNYALFSPGAFSSDLQIHSEAWDCYFDSDEVVFARTGTTSSRGRYGTAHYFSFRRETFEVDGELPAPAP